MIYLDHNATTPLSPVALAAMRPYLEQHHGNPSSIHAAGRITRAALDDARDALARQFAVKPHELIFTSGGTESDNLAILGLARELQSKGKHLITAQTEHHAVLQAFEYLAKHEGYEVTFLPVDFQGIVDVAALEKAIRPDTTLVSIMAANNETGVLQPLAEISRVCRARAVLLHSDMIQVLGKETVDLSLVDAASFAAHKFYGPLGAGLLYLHAGVSIRTLHHGGAHENQRRPGTENVASIVGLAAAACEAEEKRVAEQTHERILRDQLWEGIRALDASAILNGHPDRRLANTLNVSFPGLDGEALLIGLDLAGVCVSSGSACMVGSIQPSHVLMAMGVAEETAAATVRFSLGRSNTADEIEETIGRLGHVIRRLRSS
ncbi:MAG: cysteine desulfurase family protein [Chthoniobacterales bacterium]